MKPTDRSWGATGKTWKENNMTEHEMALKMIAEYTSAQLNDLNKTELIILVVKMRTLAQKALVT